jgi:peroxiredoxin
VNSGDSTVRRRVPVLVLLAALLGVPARAVPPDVPLSDFEGRVHNIASHLGQGQWVLVVAWAHDCHVCAAEMAELARFHREYAQKDARVVGVSIDGFELRDAAREFIERHRLPFPNYLVEPDQEIMMRFGGGPFYGTPTHYLYDPAGKLVGMSTGSITAQQIRSYIDSRKTSASR